MTTNPLHEKFERLNKRFEVLQLKAQEEKRSQEKTTLMERFEINAKNFESNLYNAKLYNGNFPMKEFALDAKYEVNTDQEEYVYTEYFRENYPYSSVTVEKHGGSSRTVKIVLLDDDRETFLNKYGIFVEERQVPEFYFVKPK